MSRLSILALVLLSHVVAPARAADIFPAVSGVAEFPNSAGPGTDIIATPVVLPGGGRAFDFGQFGQGGALCSAYTGQPDWFCASASARVEIDRQPVATTTYIGVATSIRLKAQVHLDYRNATATSAQMWAKANLTIPLACNGGVLPGGGSLNILYRLDGEYSMSVSDGAVIVKAPRPFQDCTPGGVCTINMPMFQCPDSGSVSYVFIELGPIIQIDNTVGHLGWSVLGVSDYSHTFTLEGMDAVDAQGQPLPGIRLVVPGDGGALNDVFLTGAEAAELPVSSTTSTTTATTTTTAPSCATADLAAADCRCGQRPPVGCEGVTLPKPVDKGVSTLCAKVSKAAAATGKKQRRFAKQALAIARKTLHTVDGRKGTAIPDACRQGLHGFLQATQTDVEPATH